MVERRAEVSQRILTSRHAPTTKSQRPETTHHEPETENNQPTTAVPLHKAVAAEARRSSFRLLHEPQRYRVNAVAQSRRPRPIVEKITEVRVAALAGDF